MHITEKEIHNAIYFYENGEPMKDAFVVCTIEDALVHLATELYGRGYIDGIEYIEDEVD